MVQNFVPGAGTQTWIRRRVCPLKRWDNLPSH